MRIAVVTGFIREDWHSQRLVAALGRRAEVRVADPSELVVLAERGRAQVLVAGVPARSFDAFLLARGLGRRGQADFQLEAYRLLAEEGALVVNDVGALLAAQDKLRTSVLCARAGVPTPAAVAVQDLGVALGALRRFGVAVKKPLWGSLGEGVEKLEADPAGRRAVGRALREEGVVYLQAFVPNDGRDYRAFVVGGRVAAAICRSVPPGSFVANLARGGRAVPVTLPGPFERAAVRAAEALGLDYAGVDLLADGGRPLVIEVNGNPSWRGLFQATGLDMAEAIAEHLVARARKRGREVLTHSESDRRGKVTHNHGGSAWRVGP